MKTLNNNFNTLDVLSPSTNAKNKNKTKNKNINSYSNSIKLKYRTIIPSVNLYKYQGILNKDKDKNKNNLRSRSGIKSNSKKTDYNFGSDLNYKTFTELRRHKTVNDLRKNNEKKSPSKLTKNYNNILSRKMKMLQLQQMEDASLNSFYMKTENINPFDDITNDESISNRMKINNSESQLKIKKKDKNKIKKFHPPKGNIEAEKTIQDYGSHGVIFPEIKKENNKK